jgi:hypothetical protein
MRGKKSFVLYTDLKEVVDKLPDAEAGTLFKLILDYVNDLDPKPEGLLMEVAFEPIKQQLKRDLKKWEGIIGKRSDAGKLSAAQRQLMSTLVNTSATESTDSVSDTVNDSVNWDKLVEVFNLIFHKKSRVISETVRRKYRARLKEGYTKKDIVNAMKSAKKDDYHKDTGYKYCTLEFFSRPDKLDRFLNQDQTTSTKYVATK